VPRSLRRETPRNGFQHDVDLSTLTDADRSATP